MARIITNRAELKRRRELMDAAKERARAARLAVAAVAAVPIVRIASLERQDNAGSTVPHGVGRLAFAQAPQKTATSHVNNSRPMSAAEPKVDAWLREHGDTNKMTVLTNGIASNGHRVYVVNCDTCNKDMRVRGAKELQRHVDSAAHVSLLVSGRTPETKVDAWIREHGDANKMTVLSSDDITSNGNRVYVVKCRTCNKDLRVTGADQLQRHVDSAPHVSALEYGCAPKTKVEAWIREHGDANKMAMLSNDDDASSGHRMYVVRCVPCNKNMRFREAEQLQRHVDSAAHVSALESGRAPETKVDAWLREHGDANKMTMLSNDIASSGHRIYVVKCGTCNKDLRVQSAKQLQCHVDCAAHVSALESGCTPELKVDAWIREHGDANKMTVLSNDIASNGQRLYVMKCVTCDKDMRVKCVHELQRHVDSATHVSALERGRTSET
jgi:macrodomain Ter protein organizer (MatP/YcbG family)